MIIIQDMTVGLAHAASVMPVTVVTGARQTGKSTLVRDLAPAGERPYFTLDDLDVLEVFRSKSIPAHAEIVRWCPY